MESTCVKRRIVKVTRTREGNAPRTAALRGSGTTDSSPPSTSPEFRNGSPDGFSRILRKSDIAKNATTTTTETGPIKLLMDKLHGPMRLGRSVATSADAKNETDTIALVMRLG